MIGDFSDNLKDIIVWDKGHGQPAMQSNVLNRRTELLLIFEDEKDAISRMFKYCNFDRGTENDIWEIPRGKKIKGHGATFPEKLVEKILYTFALEGDVVYDPFMGTGTTAVVAKKLKLDYIGSEISEEYIKMAEERLIKTEV